MPVSLAKSRKALAGGARGGGGGAIKFFEFLIYTGTVEYVILQQ